MNNKCAVQFRKIVAVALILGSLSPALVKASYPILKLDCSNKNDPAQTEPGFTAAAQ